jgi:hypothetical protein
MTEETVADKAPPKGNDKTITGISIASFLQMLEQERQTCSVQVQSGDESGILYFADGNLIDAEQENMSGTEAAYTIVSWKNPSIALGKTDTRPRQIEHPLGYILLNAAKQQDELAEPMATNPTITYVSDEIKADRNLQKNISVLSAIEGIRHFYLLNKTGKIVAHSAPNTELGELLIYCIITSSNLRKSLHVKSPRRIQMQMKDGSSLLIIPKAGIIIGLIIETHRSSDEIANRINTGLSAK